MSRNGSGTYTPPAGSWTNPVNGQAATSGDWTALLNDLSAALTQSVSRDGQSPLAGNLNLGGNKITDLSDASGTGQALTFAQLFNQGTEADLASAATTDIGAQLTNFLRITGTTTITSFGTNYKGPRFLRFSGAVLLTNSATLALPGGANITTAAGDCLIAIPTATLGTADGWKVVAYQSSSVKPLGNITAGKVLGRDTSGAGAVQELPIAVDSSGNVGIGTSSPTSKLHVAGTGTQSITVERTDASTAGLFQLLSGASTNVINASTAKPISFEINGTERARIDSSGNLLVGATTQQAKLTVTNGANTNRAMYVEGYPSGLPTSLFYRDNTDAQYVMQVRHDSAVSSSIGYMIQFVNQGGTGVGSITSTGSATSYTTSSDYRLKENIAPMTGALSVVQQLKPCTYNWKADGSDGQGFIAHELQAVVPDCVTGEKDAVDEDGNPKYQGIDTSFLIATLTAAIQELKAEFDAYKATHP